MAIAYNGYKPATAKVAYWIKQQTVDVGNQKATKGPRVSTAMYAFAAHGRVGRFDTSPLIRFAIWDETDLGGPGELLGRTAEFSAGTAMLDESDGTTYSRALESAVLLMPGQTVFKGFTAKNAVLAYGVSGEIHPAIGIDNQVYRKTIGTTTTPQDPFAATGTEGTLPNGDEMGLLSIWLECQIATAPTIPAGSLVPVNGAVLSDLTPTFRGDFADADLEMPNGAPSPEKLNRVYIRVGTSVDSGSATVTNVVWNYAYNAAAGEQTANEFGQTYIGSALTPGAQYWWQASVSDQAGLRSKWTVPISFTVGVGSINTSAGTPSGKQQTRTPGPFTGVWANPSGSAAKYVWLQIRKKNGEMIRDSPRITLGTPVAVGGTISIPWASTGFIQLPNGSTGENDELNYRIRAEDVATVATGWSNGRTFAINTPPSIPAPIAPADGIVTSARPELVVAVTDPDDTIGSGLVVNARILAADGATVIATRPMTYDATNAVWRYQTVAADLATTGTVYFWDAWSFDGTVYGSGNDSLGAGSLSPLRSLTYSSGPVVTISAPANLSTVNTNTPLIDWSVSSQQRFQVTVMGLLPGTNTYGLVYQSAETVSGTTAHRIPAGYLENGDEYRVTVTVWDLGGIRGDSVETIFTVDISELAEITGFQVSPHIVAGERIETAVVLTWDPTTYTSGQFDEWIVMRRAVDDGLFEPDEPESGENKRIAVLTSPSDRSFIDYTAAADTTYVYSIKQVATIDLGGGDLVQQVSATQRQEITLNFDGTVICSARNPGARRIVLPYREDRQIGYPGGPSYLPIWGSRRPRAVDDGTFYRTVNCEYKIAGTELERLALIHNLEKLLEYGGTMVYRDGRRHRWYGNIANVRYTDAPAGGLWTLSFEFTQTDAREKAIA